MKNYLIIIGVMIGITLIAIGSFIAYYVLFFIIFVVFTFVLGKLVVFAKEEHTKQEEEFVRRDMEKKRGRDAFIKT